jgi:hypothetical protein
MKITMDDSRIVKIQDIKEFLKLDSSFNFTVDSKKEKYKWIEEVLRKFGYLRLKKRKERIVVRKYIHRVTKISKSQLTRLIKRFKERRRLLPSYGTLRKNGFPVKYYPKDISLLIETDTAHRCINGQAIKSILKREYEVFKKKEYQTIKNISVGHIYNIRNDNRQYNSSGVIIFKRTQSVQIPIGERRKPQPYGKPGFIRVDSVHQGDLDKDTSIGLSTRKGVYHVNSVDEITQWEIVGCVEGISERYMIPLLEEMINQYPFKIIGFHADNGSEYINYRVVDLLNRLLVKLTKSRARQTNDNALVESKNGSVIRKYLGYGFISQINSKKINEFYRSYLNPYLNFHRPCGYATLIEDKKGKIRKKYKTYLTPYEKLKSLDNYQTYLKDKILVEYLEDVSRQKSDNEFGREVQDARRELFKKFKK